MNQRERILQYIQDFGSITYYEAVVELGILQFGARLKELKEQGYTFNYEWITKKNRYNKPIRFKRYKLGGANENRDTIIDKTEKKLTKDLVQS